MLRALLSWSPRSPRVEGLVALGAYALAYAVRARDLDASGLLGDAVGPWLAASASPFNLHAHAPPYGWGLHPPYALSMLFADSLRQAVANLLGLHALEAPVAALLAGRLGGVLPAITAGALVALDGGLLDTARSGSEAYLAALWVGVMVLCGSKERFSVLAGPAWAMASMNHPLALATAPLLALGGRRALPGALVGALMLAPQLPRWWSEAPTPSEADAVLVPALSAWLRQGGGSAYFLLLAPLIGALRARTRRLALGTLLAGLLLSVAGWKLGYLRDHHLRLLTIPAAACAAALPGPTALLPLLLLRWPASELPEPGHPHRPGTLGLTTEITAKIAALPPPVLVDGAWISGTPAAEPGAVMLDLWLRGQRGLGPGGSVAVIVSYERGDEPPFEPKLSRGDRYFIASDGLDSLASALCGHARLGGAYNGLAALRPELGLEAASGWRAACPEESP